MSAASKVTCPCGAVLQVTPAHAGKSVKCPKCGQHVTVPESSVAASPAAIRVTCQCGKVLKVKPNLAGKQVKCPGCGRPLAIPSPSPSRETAPVDLGGPNDDPLGLGALTDTDPLGIGDTEGSPFGLHSIEASTTATPARSGVATRTPGAEGRTGRAAISLRDLAGWVAVCFGGYQVVVSGISILSMLLGCVLGGSLISLFGFGTVLPALLLALGMWLALLGVNIVRQVSPRQSLERAAQASMVYIALFILGLVLAVIPLARLVAQSAELGLFAIASIVTNAIYIAPPAFIIYVDSQQQ